MILEMISDGYYSTKMILSSKTPRKNWKQPKQSKGSLEKFSKSTLLVSFYYTGFQN